MSTRGVPVSAGRRNPLSKRMCRIRRKSLETQTRPAASFEAPGSRTDWMTCDRSAMTAAVISSMSRMPMSVVMVSIAIAIPRIAPVVMSVAMPTVVGAVGRLRIVLNGRGIVGLRSAVRLWSVIGRLLSVIPAADLITASRVVAAPAGITTLALGLGGGICRANGKGDGPCENSKSQLHFHKALLTGICSTRRHTALPQVDHSMHTQIDIAGWSYVSGRSARLSLPGRIPLALIDRADYRELRTKNVRCSCCDRTFKAISEPIDA